MIQVILSKIENIDGFYKVTLGNGCHYDFKSKKKAMALNALTSRFLTKKVLLLNEIYTDLFSISRKQWVIRENRQGKGKNHFDDYQKVYESLDNVNHWLEYLTSYRCNSGVYAFICVQKIINEFELLFDLIGKAFSTYPVYSVAISLEKERYITRQIYKDVQNFGLDDCTRIVTLLINDFESHFKQSFLKVS